MSGVLSGNTCARSCHARPGPHSQISPFRLHAYFRSRNLLSTQTRVTRVLSSWTVQSPFVRRASRAFGELPITYTPAEVNIPYAGFAAVFFICIDSPLHISSRQPLKCVARGASAMLTSTLRPLG